MNFCLFVCYYLICSLVLFIILFLVFRFILKRKSYSLSKLAEKEIDNYFHAYDDNINSLLNDLKEEGDSDDDSVNW